MINTWLKKDLEKIYENHSIAVFIDESRDAEFLLRCLEGDYEIFQAHTEIDELHVKYLIEKNESPGSKKLIYTRTARDRLKFIREYCETNGCIEIRYLHNYIKEKVHRTLNLNLNLPREDLIAAAKISIGKDSTYWMDISHKGAGEIFDLEKELLPFLDDPQCVIQKYDDQLRDTFYRKVNDLLKQEYIEKPPETLAREVVNTIFDGLLKNLCDKTLESVYCNWLDSMTYKSSIHGYIKSYKLLKDVDIWQVSPSHPFREIDELWLKEIGENIYNKDKLQGYLTYINQRNNNRQAQNLGISFWPAVKALLEFDEKNIDYLNSFQECVEFYQKHFFTLDGAVRTLYTEFLNKKELLDPFQEYYRNLVVIFLDKWFKYFDEYKQNQTGTLQRIIDENNCKTGIIVGDGVAFEIAQNIVKKVSKKYKLSNNIILADIPTDTENNLSRIYMANGIVEKIHKNRETYLSDSNPDKNIGYAHLDQVSEDVKQYQYLICTYKDIDDMGEKLQHKALKYFAETEDYFAQNIEILLNNGYKKVYLVTDHGFVLTGILSEADKIEVDFSGNAKKSERYIRTSEKQQVDPAHFIEKEQQCGEYNYLYFSTTLNPFKTPGVYGYSHGGISPQELITPFICWENTTGDENMLEVKISNKKDLQSVTGEIFQVKLSAPETSDDLFSMERKVYLVFFSEGQQVSKSDIMTIKNKQQISKDYAFDSHSVIDVQLLDAQTKGQLDRVQVKQNKDRDLGGLI